MPDPTPIGRFRFELLFSGPALAAGGDTGAEPGGAFAECSGLEATMEPRTIREGGRNYGAHQRPGPVTFATVILRRGITANVDLWDWFQQASLQGAYTHRRDVTIAHLDFEGRERVRTWRLSRALPVKFRSADLDARSGEVAIEELHLVHEGLRLT